MYHVWVRSGVTWAAAAPTGRAAQNPRLELWNVGVAFVGLEGVDAVGPPTLPVQPPEAEMTANGRSGSGTVSFLPQNRRTDAHVKPTSVGRPPLAAPAGSGGSCSPEQPAALWPPAAGG